MYPRMGPTQSHVAGSITAPQVFAIPELLEAILHYLPWRDLFVLQSVDSRFQQVIAESAPLRRAMSLQRPINPHDPAEWPNYCIISPLLTGEMLSWGRFNSGGDGFDWHIDSAGLVFSITYSVWNPECPRTPKLYAPLGIWTTRQKSRAQARGSWESMKLTSFPFRVCIRISVKWNQSMGLDYSGWPHYQDRITLGVGSTIGDFMQVLTELDNRSFEEHEVLWSAQYRTATLGQVKRARHIRIRSRLRCSACRWWKGLHEENRFDDGGQHHWCCLEQDYRHCGQCP